MRGGPSHVDIFDPKPALARLDSLPPPEEFHQLKLQFTDVKKQKLTGSQQTFTRCGSINLGFITSGSSGGRRAATFG